MPAADYATITLIPQKWNPDCISRSVERPFFVNREQRRTDYSRNNNKIMQTLPQHRNT